MKRNLLALLLVVPALAHAHTGVGHSHGFLDGLNHPVHGLDHLLAMIAVGLWAAQLGGRAIWAVPASFVGVMALGGLLGVAGWPLPMVETGILLSVFLLGLLIAFAVRLPLWAGAALVAFFALFHGYAHGAEMPAGASSAWYAGGFVLATAALHLAGIGLGIALKNVPFAPALRVAGALVILGGAVVALS
jgi:urease accessory protein